MTAMEKAIGKIDEYAYYDTNYRNLVIKMDTARCFFCITKRNGERI